METRLTFRYDREADILHIDKCLPYPAQESEELSDEVIARINPCTNEVENHEVLFFSTRLLRNELFELPNRLVFGEREHLLVVVASQVGLEAMDAAQVDLTAGHHGKKDRETASGARGADALAGGGLRHVIADHEKIEEGRVTELGPQFAPVDGVDVAEQPGVALVVLPDQVAELVEQRVVVQGIERRLGGHQ